MKILLVYPPSKGQPPVRFPRLGLAYLTATLQQDNHTVSILDLDLYPNIQEMLANRLKQFKPDLVGFSCPTVTFLATQKLAEQVREFSKDILIVLGGPHPTSLQEEILERYNQFDVAVIGEGEITMNELCRTLVSGQSLDSVKGIIFRKINAKGITEVIKTPLRPPIQDLDTIPFPDYSQFDLDKYTQSPELFSIYTSRGCPWGHCIYCCSNVNITGGFRSRSAENVLAEIRLRIKEYGTWYFKISDDFFSYDKERILKICNAIKNENLNIQWDAEARANMLDFEVLQSMKNAGCQYVSYGIESVHDDVLKKMAKGVTVAQAVKAVEMTRQAGMKVRGFFLVGSPGDNYSKAIDSLKFSIKHDLDYAKFNMLRPYPRTPLWTWVEQHGRFLVPKDELIHYDNLSEQPVFETDDFTCVEKVKAYKEITEGWEKHRLERTIINKLPLGLQTDSVKKVMASFVHKYKQSRWLKRIYLFVKKSCSVFNVEIFRPEIKFE